MEGDEIDGLKGRGKRKRVNNERERKREQSYASGKLARANLERPLLNLTRRTKEGSKERDGETSERLHGVRRIVRFVSSTPRHASSNERTLK